MKTYDSRPLQKLDGVLAVFLFFVGGSLFVYNLFPWSEGTDGKVYSLWLFGAGLLALWASRSSRKETIYLINTLLAVVSFLAILQKAS